MGGDPIPGPRPFPWSPVDVIILSRPCKLSRFLKVPKARKRKRRRCR